MEYQSMSQAIRGCIENYPLETIFGLWDLKRDLFKAYPPSKNSHADTVSRRMREIRHGRDYDIICVEPNKSRYVKAGKKSPYQKLKRKKVG